MTTKEYAIQCIKDEAQALLDLIPHIDKDFEKAVELMYNCKGKIIVTGVGKSAYRCQNCRHVIQYWYSIIFCQSIGCISW